MKRRYDTEVDRLRAELKVARALHVASKERDEARRERDEARRERDEALSRVAAEAGKDLAAWAADLDAAEAAHARVVAERDEARAELKLLKGRLCEVCETCEKYESKFNAQWADLERIASLCGRTADEHPLQAVARVVRERDEARASAEESEHQMHLRIRAGYDNTIADSWRAKVAEVERERDAARDAYKFRGGYVEDASGDRWWSVGLLSKAEQERDEARAEVERLRERLVATETEVALMCATAEREAASSPNGADRTEAAERALAYGAVLELLRKGRG